jgi:hypothetical protein
MIDRTTENTENGFSAERFSPYSVRSVPSVVNQVFGVRT